LKVRIQLSVREEFFGGKIRVVNIRYLRELCRGQKAHARDFSVPRDL